MAIRAPAEAHSLFEEKLNSHDLDALVFLYEPEAKMVPQPGQQPVAGIQAIREVLQGLLALKPKIRVETKSVIQAGDIALLRAQWHLTGTGPDGKPIEMSHDSAEVVRWRPDGTWRYVIDHPFGSD